MAHLLLLLMTVGRMRERKKGNVAHLEGNRYMSDLPCLKYKHKRKTERIMFAQYTLWYTFVLL